MTSRRAFWPALFALAAIIAAAAAHNYAGPKVAYRTVVLDSRSGNPLRVVLVLPPKMPPPRSAPAVIAIPPYSIPPEAMDVICVELARRGAVCAIPDFFGQNPAESRQRMGKDSLEVMTRDMLTIVAFLRAQPFVDPDRIGSCGHSVGGTVSFLLGEADPTVRATVPIGMQADYGPKVPQNLLFLSGLYDEIHSPRALLDGLKRNGVTDHPQNRVLYGSFADGTARQVTIIPTTDHFIETFDPWLIRELLSWYARSFDRPGLAQGPLREWRSKVAVFLFTFFTAAFYALAGALIAGLLARRWSSRRPGWLISRLLALPALALIALVWWEGNQGEETRLAAVYLMAALLPAQEFINHRTNAALGLQDRSPFRRFRSAGLILLALGAGTLISFGLACLPDYWLIPDSWYWHPVFAANMALLFPLEVWGRSMPLLFADTITTVRPGAAYYVLLGLVVLAPGLLMRGAQRLAQEIVATVRAGLKPLHQNWTPPEVETEVAPPRNSAVKIALLVVLAAVLAFLSYRRIAEGMLTLETGLYAGLSILRFAVLPFVITALIVRTRVFRRLALLD